MTTHGTLSDLIRCEAGHTEFSTSGRPGHHSAAPASVDCAPSELPEAPPFEPEAEPRVTWVRDDWFGLALSGGGIRSAAFNLGVFQALATRNLKSSLLDHLKYLSTVSGGGYIGGFWTRWLEQNPTGRTGIFPQVNNGPEPVELRRLRQNSRFIVPRSGFLRAEVWNVVVAILGGTLPAMGFAIASLLMLVLAWYALDVAFAPLSGASVDERRSGLIRIALATLVVHSWLESLWLRKRVNKAAFLGRLLRYVFLVVSVSAVLLVGVDAVGRDGPHWFAPLVWQWPEYWAPAGLWGLLGGIGLVLRGLLSRMKRNELFRTIEHSAARFLGCALVWCVLVGNWKTVELFDEVLPWSGVSTFSTAALFAVFRDWLAKPAAEANGDRLLERLAPLIKPKLPQALAMLTLIGMLVGSTALVRLALEHGWVWWLLAIAATVFIASCVFFDPRRVGLHDFYRSRIAASFLGAARGKDRANLSEELAGDDVCLDESLKKRLEGNAVHLVCCTGNNLAGDPLPNLYRGGRSVAISRYGASLGDYYAEMPDLSLSSVLTASAAAFNSQMGSVSMDLGRAVTFVMCALNLRLGLWIPHPGSPSASRLSRVAPGLFFFFEMIARSRTEPSEAGVFDQVHLSDGGHFENLALYELIRRHCRYIIVSDCGADPRYEFADLGNAVRRIREDFGIEVEIDPAPLRPGPNGLAQQHVAVGTIHYDGAAGADKGTLLYFKPNLAGEEPVDVQEYRAKNPLFPHQSTGDQFFDEAQWESYRRLGLHSVTSAFRHVRENIAESEARFVDRVFMQAIERWQQPRNINRARMAHLAERRDAWVTKIRESAPAHLRWELLPVLGQLAASALPEAKTVQKVSAEAHAQALLLCVEVASLMEDVWDSANLDIHWAHPSNQGWMSFFHVCASTASFREYWTLIRPMYRDAFRDFVKNRFGIRQARSSQVQLGEVGRPTSKKCLPSELSGPAVEEWRRRYGPFTRGSAIEYSIQVLDASVPVGFLVYDQEVSSATWRSHELFVPPGLMGSGIASRLLDEVLLQLTPGTCVVELVDEGAVSDVGELRELSPDMANRELRVRLLNFYKSRGFVQECESGRRLYRVLGEATPEQSPSSMPRV